MSKIKLVSFDLDGTLFMKPTFYYLCEKISKSEELNKIIEKYKNDAKKKRKNIHKLVNSVLDLDKIYSYLDHIPKIKGIKNIVSLLKKRGLRVVLLSDVESIVSSYLKRYGFDDVIGSEAIVKNNRIVAEKKTLDDKLIGLKEYCETSGIKLKECVHIGNDLNDIPVFKKVGLSIATNPTSNEVEKNATYSIKTNNLSDVYKIFKKGISFS